MVPDRAAARPEALLALLAVACALPSDHSDELIVALDPVPSMFVGDTFPLTAHFVDGPPAGASEQDILFAADDPAVAIVTPDRRLLAVGIGPVRVTARVSFADAPPAAQTVTVGTGVRVDSAVPTQVRYGDTLRIYGLGLNPSLTRVTLGGTPLAVRGYSRDVPTSANGTGVLTAWVVGVTPTSARVTATGVRGTSTGSFVVRVQQEDRYEPNSTAPADLGTLVDPLGNPGLVLEATGVPDSQVNRDWYTFTNPVLEDVTVTMRMLGPFTADEFSLALTDSLTTEGFERPDHWMIAPGANYCRGAVVPGPQSVDSQVIALKGLPPGSYHVLVRSRTQLLAPRPYALRIETGYRSNRSPDASEENDHCGLAREYVRIGIFDYYLSTDNPGDVDWFWFFVTGTGLRNVSFGTVVSAGVPPLLTILTDSAPARIVASRLLSVSADLAGGRYLLAVSDASGVPSVFALGHGPGSLTARFSAPRGLAQQRLGPVDPSAARR